jgi:hypothetical protein
MIAGTNGMSADGRSDNVFGVHAGALRRGFVCGLKMKPEDLLEIKVQHNARLRGEVIELQRRLEKLQSFIAGLCDPDRDGWSVQPHVRKKAKYFLEQTK